MYFNNVCNKQIKNTDLPPYFLNAEITRKGMFSLFCLSLVINALISYLL